MQEPTVEITRRGVDRVRQGHLWVYESDVSRAEGTPQGGVVRVVDGRGWFLGRAYWSEPSLIKLRMLTSEDVPIDREFLAARLDAALELRARLFGPEVEALRLVHTEGDLLPGLIVDRYADVVVFQTLSRGADSHRELFIELLQERLSPRAIVERNDVRIRAHEGLPERKGVVRGEAPGVVTWREGGLELQVDPVEGQKTGGFLDQRENHVRAAEYVRPGDRCLDAFSYVGGFALQLARAGGRVTALEISRAALDDAEVAARRNGLELETVEANAFDWLKARSLGGEPFDLIVLDPPAFAKNKASLENAIRGYKEINLRALQLLAPGGRLITCSCSYHMNEALLIETVQSAAADAGRRLQLLEKRGAGRDHPALLGVPETAYLKCLVFRRVD